MNLYMLNTKQQSLFIGLWAAALLIAALGLVVWAQPALANNTTYYIDNQSGSNCSNTGAGTSSSAPWCDFTPVNSATFQPGDQILLARGAAWNMELHLNGSGTSNSWITLDAYGSGNKPKISRNSNASDRTVYMYDPSYWNVRNLEIANAGNGIRVEYTTLGNEGLRFENLYIHDINLIVNGSPTTSDGVFYSTGILFIGDSSVFPTSSQWVARDIVISNSEIGYTTSPVTFFHVDSDGTHYPYSFRDVRFKNLYIHDAKGPVSLTDLTNFKMISSIMENVATVPLIQGTTGIFQWATENVAYVNNYMHGVPDTDSFDMSMIDTEGKANNTYFYGNYIADTAGSAIEFLQLLPDQYFDRENDHNTNNHMKSNVFHSNNYAINAYNASSNPDPSGTITDNFYHEPGTGLFIGPSSGFTISNNLNIVSSSNLYNGASQFSDAQGQNQWSYQLFNGSSYTNLSYDSTNQWWGSSSGYVSRFDLLPNSASSNWVSRAWTAPSGGTISIRGWVLKNDIAGGDGVKVCISKNGNVIWPAEGNCQSIAYDDDIGMATNLNSVTVAANDVIRFEVNNAENGNASNDVTSWSASIAYFTDSDGTRIENSSTDIVYSTGDWTDGDDLHYSNTVGAEIEYTFEGTGINWIGTKNNNHGKVDIYIDGSGTPDATVDTYSATWQLDQVLYSKTGLSYGTHTIRIVLRSDKNPSSSGYYTDIDAFVLPSVYENTDANISYSSGDWTLSGPLHYAYSTGAHAEFSFNGTGVTWVGTSNYDHGKVDIYIDGSGTPAATVDTYSASWLLDQALYTITGLSDGLHTIKIVLRNDKNASSSGYFQDIDLFSVYP